MNSNKLFFQKKKDKLQEQKKLVFTCLLGLLIISRASAQSTTSTGLMASTYIYYETGSPGTGQNAGGTDSCSVSAGDMFFDAYKNLLISATSTVFVTCTNNTNYSISFNDTPEATPAYYLVRVGGTSTTVSDRLNVTFKNTTGDIMVKDNATISGTGNGSSAVAGTITGTLAAGQTGKTAGSYSKIMTLNIMYNSNPCAC